MRKRITLTYKNIEMKYNSDSLEGKVVSYIKESSSSTKSIIENVLTIWFASSALDRNAPEYEETVLSNIAALEGRIKVIKQMSGISFDQEMDNLSSCTEQEELIEDEDELEEEKEIGDGFLDLGFQL